MAVYPKQGIAINVEKQGLRSKGKPGFELRFGKYSEIITPEYEFVFNLNGEIKFIKGKKGDWPHPFEQLKRTDGNDWVYYSCGKEGGEKAVLYWLGEYYLPCLPYPSNSPIRSDYFGNPVVMQALGAWSMLYGTLHELTINGLQPRDKDLVERILAHNENVLYQRSKDLQAITGGRISVLPPDTRSVDYEVIPLAISRGCLYHCGFCCVKSTHKFEVLPKEDALAQLDQITSFYGRNLENYRGLFLGNHDALSAGPDAICFGAQEALSRLNLGKAFSGKPCLYLFGSVGALLKWRQEDFEKLDQLPYSTWINIGFESVDAATLEYIKKPISQAQVQEAFGKMLDINAQFENIEVTGNFLMGETLPPSHYPALEALLENAQAPPRGKGAVYLSPLKGHRDGEDLLARYFKIKKLSNLPVYVYLIQRL